MLPVGGGREIWKRLGVMDKEAGSVVMGTALGSCTGASLESTGSETGWDKLEV